jgi:hypothetical protein
VITLVSGEKIVVLETAEEVMTKIFQYRRELRKVMTPEPPPGVPDDPPEYPEYPWGPEIQEEPEEPPEDQE